MLATTLITPYKHRDVYTRRRGVFAFRDKFLTYELHLDKRVIDH